MKMYEVRLSVAEDRLSTIIEVVNGTATVVAVNAVTAPNRQAPSTKRAAPPPLKKPRHRRQPNYTTPFKPKRTDGVTCKSALLDFLADGQRHSAHEAMALLSGLGFAPTSLGPLTSELRRKMEIVIHADGALQRVGGGAV